MKKIIIIVIFGCWAGIVLAQTFTSAVNNTIAQDNQRAQTDNTLISQLLARINALNADMQSAINDANSYNSLASAATNADVIYQKNGTIPTVAGFTPVVSI